MASEYYGYAKYDSPSDSAPTTDFGRGVYAVRGKMSEAPRVVEYVGGHRRLVGSRVGFTANVEFEPTNKTFIDLAFRSVSAPYPHQTLSTVALALGRYDTGASNLYVYQDGKINSLEIRIPAGQDETVTCSAEMWFLNFDDAGSFSLPAAETGTPFESYHATLTALSADYEITEMTWRVENGLKWVAYGTAGTSGVKRRFNAIREGQEVVSVTFNCMKRLTMTQIGGLADAIVTNMAAVATLNNGSNTLTLTGANLASMDPVEAQATGSDGELEWSYTFGAAPNTASSFTRAYA